MLPVAVASEDANNIQNTWIKADLEIYVTILEDTLSSAATVILSIHLQISTHVVGTCIIPSPNLHISKQYVCHRLLWISANTWWLASPTLYM